jgi:hypothetical protein
MYRAIILTLSSELWHISKIYPEKAGTHVIVRSSRRGTISSTSVFGCFASAVYPVAQHYQSAITNPLDIPAPPQRRHSTSSSRKAPYIPEPYRGVERTALFGFGIVVDSPTYLSGRSR